GDGARKAAEDLGHILGGADGEALLEAGPLLLGGPTAAQVDDPPVDAAAGGQAPHPELTLELVAAVGIREDHARAGGRAGTGGEHGQREELSHRRSGDVRLLGGTNPVLGLGLVLETEASGGKGLEALL